MLLPRVITKLVGWAVAVFYDVERTGPPLVDGAVLVTANHPNALVDPLVIFRTGQRPSRPLAKASLFDQALTGTLLRGLGRLPVYRRQDDPALMHLNERTFDAAVSALQAGEAVQIYPEGRSHSEPSLTPIRTGAARIALRAAAERDWTLDVQVQPVGLTYTRKHLFRGRVVAALLGVAVWALPYGLTRHVAPRFRPKLDQVATYKLGMAILAFPLWWGLTLLAAWFQWGLGPAALVAAALPAAGLAAIAWRERQAQVRQDVLVFWRVIKHRGGRDRLLDQRTALVGAFDELTAAWQVDRGRA